MQLRDAAGQLDRQRGFVEARHEIELAVDPERHGQREHHAALVVAEPRRDRLARTTAHGLAQHAAQRAGELMAIAAEARRFEASQRIAPGRRSSASTSAISSAKSSATVPLAWSGTARP